MSTEGWRVGIDAGGTFTDLLAVGPEGRSVRLKVPSTPDDPVQGPLAALDALRREIGADQIGDIAHGTTVGLNALLQRRFPRVALITTRGFRHVLEIGRHNVPGQWGAIYSWVKPQRVVPLDHVIEVDERVDARGRVTRALDRHDIDAAIERVAALQAQTVAVCLIHAYRNDEHERAIAARLAESLPGVPVSLSSAIMPEFREYERMITTAMNAVLVPLIGAYAARFAAEAARRQQPGARVFIMRSVGGVVPAAEAAREPLRTALSGPAAGVIGMGRLALAAGFEHALTFDMGGTSTDVAAVAHGEPGYTTEGHIDAYPLRAPSVDIVTIGAGGGSVIATGLGQRLTVGPRSAGARPGPACYGHSELATVTDANLLLGRLPAALLGGTFAIDAAAARAALGAVARPLALAVETLALSALAVVNHNMAGAVRQVSIRRGIDVRDHALVAFGGAGPLHAAELARLLGIATVVIPPHPGLGSCDGLLLADIAVDDVRTCVLSGPELSASAIGPVLASLRERLGKRLPATGHIDFTAEMRYVGMGSELRVRLAADDLGAQDLAPLLERFHSEHQRLFGFSYRDRHPVQLLALRATLSVARGGRIGNVKLPCDDAGAAAIGVRHALLAREHGFEPVPVFRRDQLPAGFRLDGPAFIDQYDSTTIVMHNQAMHVDPHGNLILGLRW